MSCRGPINVRGDRSEHRPLDDVGLQQALALDPPHAVKGLGERAGGFQQTDVGTNFERRWHDEIDEH